MAAVAVWDVASVCAGTAAGGGSGAKRISPILFMLFCSGVMSTSQLISNSSEPEGRDGEKHANHVPRVPQGDEETNAAAEATSTASVTNKCIKHGVSLSGRIHSVFTRSSGRFETRSTCGSYGVCAGSDGGVIRRLTGV